MRISQVFRARQAIVRVLILPLLLWCIDAPALAKLRIDEGVRLSVKAVEVKGDIILISYDLVVPAGEKYEVSIVMMKEKVPSVKIPVRSASGDVGESTYTSGAKQVRWEYKKDIPSGLWGDGFYVEITINRASGTSVWWYVGIGAVVLGGGAALAGGKKSNGSSTPTVPPVIELPSPPSRPGN